MLGNAVGCEGGVVAACPRSCRDGCPQPPVVLVPRAFIAQDEKQQMKTIRYTQDDSRTNRAEPIQFGNFSSLQPGLARICLGNVHKNARRILAHCTLYSCMQSDKMMLLELVVICLFF